MRILHFPYCSLEKKQKEKSLNTVTGGGKQQKACRKLLPTWQQSASLDLLEVGVKQGRSREISPNTGKSVIDAKNNLALSLRTGEAYILGLIVDDMQLRDQVAGSKLIWKSYKIDRSLLLTPKRFIQVRQNLVQAYPSDKEIAMAAEALEAKHRCLKESGSETGWNGWKNSIKFKMGNYRNRMRQAGCQEVIVNAGKRKFQPIMNQNLPNTFYAELDRDLPRMITFFRQKASKTGKTADALAEILKIHDEQEIHDIHTKCTPVLHALPVYQHEDVSGFFRTYTDESDEPEPDGVAVGLLTVISDHDTSPVHYNPVRISVVIESDAVVSLPRLGDAFLVIFGLIYALHLSYPKALTNTFEFTQTILLGLESGKLSPRLHTLKKDLMM
ncbi:Hypothetical protein SMAX5B_016920 [Scophthalmus maximus]|uniref:Sterile alpha motif domain-containing protein 3-like n=1 Tax=Scophthalmus maximus TaxID=52904 RepID=A0A2U9CJY2_SCOMX|nr:Hypothetical protein SMAX5B_016920 [Scophthalmus maximus]